MNFSVFIIVNFKIPIPTRVRLFYLFRDLQLAQCRVDAKRRKVRYTIVWVSKWPLYNDFVCLALDSHADKIIAPDRKKYEDDMEAVLNEIKEKDALLVSFVYTQYISGDCCFC